MAQRNFEIVQGFRRRDAAANRAQRLRRDGITVTQRTVHVLFRFSTVPRVGVRHVGMRVMCC